MATFSPALSRVPLLTELVGVDSVVLEPSWWQAPFVDFVVGWGLKPSAKKAERYARLFRIPYVRIEDGFLRSVGLGVDGEPPRSIVLDDLGIYYDATRVSRLEALLNTPGPVCSSDMRARAERCLQAIRAHRLSKYNHVTSAPGSALERTATTRVLVVDQTYGDLSVKLGLVPEDGFRAMLETAVKEHPEAEILVKTHPDVMSGKKKGFLTNLESFRVQVLDKPANPIALLEHVDEVYVATSQLGFEALMLGKNVHCFGVPFYAGWGLTDDRVLVPRRTQKRSLAEVFAAAYLLYARYVNPRTGNRCELEEFIEYLVEERRRRLP